MVKRLITIIIITILLIALAITELILVEKFIKDLEMEVNKLVIMYEENKDNIVPLAQEVDALDKKLDSKEQLLGLMYNYKDINVISDCMTKIVEYSKQNNYDDAIVELKILQEYAHKNHDTMGCNFNNIL